MERRYGDAVVITLVDIFRATQRFPFTHFPELWPLMIGGQGRVWGAFYRLSNHPLLVRTAHTAIWPYVRGNLLRLLLTHPTDVIVSFHGIPNLSLLWTLRRLPARPALISVTQDLVSVHAAFFPPGFDFYFVPTEAAREKVIHWGIPPELVEAVGNPVRPSLVDDARLPQTQAREILGLEPAQWVLITGGNDEKQLSAILRAIARQRPGLHVAVITGRNETLRRRLQQLELQLHLRIEGFVKRMGLWLNAADVIITKAGPNALSEIFVTGRPSILFHAIPGQESGNVDYAVQGGAAIWTPSAEQVARVLDQLLADKSRRERMSAAAHRLSRPEAAHRVAEAIYRFSEMQS